jgi:hypothetical protein
MVIHKESVAEQDSDRSEPLAKAGPLPSPREFAASGSIEIVPTVASLPVPRYRRPRPVGSG